MTVRDFVADELCIPVTLVGFYYMVEGIELVLDTRESKFYKRLADITHTSPRYLEKALRDSKNMGLRYMDDALKREIFKKSQPTTTEYIHKTADYYRRTYENKE